MKRSEALLVANGAIGMFCTRCPEEVRFLEVSRILNEMIQEEEAKEEQE